MEYLLAGCIMTKEERIAVKDVVKDRVEPKTTTEPDAKTDAIKKPRFQCNQCPISFLMASNLEQHVLKKHPMEFLDVLDTFDKKNSESGDEFLNTIKTFQSASDTLKKTNNLPPFTKTNNVSILPIGKENVSPIPRGVVSPQRKFKTLPSFSKSKIVSPVRGDVKVVSPVSKVKENSKKFNDAGFRRKDLSSTTPILQKKTSMILKRENRGNESL